MTLLYYLCRPCTFYDAFLWNQNFRCIKMICNYIEAFWINLGFSNSCHLYKHKKHENTSLHYWCWLTWHITRRHVRTWEQLIAYKGDEVARKIFYIMFARANGNIATEGIRDQSKLLKWLQHHRTTGNTTTKYIH